MYTPTFRSPLTERTEIMVTYDDRYIYLGARLHDSEPRKVRANTLYRDRYSGDDIVALVLDTYNDRQTASWFTVNPAGNRIDRALSNDGEFTGSDPMNDNWNALWDVATSQSDSGWSAEMRIPFSSLGFQDVNGQVTMGLIAYRMIARKNERQLFPAIPPNWDLGFAKPSQSQRVVLEGVHSRRPVYVTPYGLGGVSWRSELDPLHTRYIRPSDETHEGGVDFKYSPTSNLALDLTANTDFAQVEADDQQVNLTRFSLFFPEKRQFFQERSAIFDFSTGGVSRLFHSRTIGLGEDGTPLRIYGGGRLVGRAGGLDVGFLDLQTWVTRPDPLRKLRRAAAAARGVQRQFDHRDHGHQPDRRRRASQRGRRRRCRGAARWGANTSPPGGRRPTRPAPLTRRWTGSRAGCSCAGSGAGRSGSAMPASWCTRGPGTTPAWASRSGPTSPRPMRKSAISV
jgi:hypothetical protein